ncbi:MULTISPECIES: anaerobic ribonucleoside-triphosphate reductase activating protein [unclassified Paraburkholderia]|uniref:anaerobic ribonucleoside-triphosphate reductase activating protein n=1 Tax=unclassified Paraburkholderia TaxID=2615204 RepID=UPI0020B8FCAB|nr:MULTISPECIES: anaerobic ribonucleoside-triphosphate reductase activating protein [unclassified Paraburkholderia]MCP3720492.1 anaerobic ribonucleoside-triphosphate reductase activating protein [Paraburkholderia sp. CNPSo 3281]MCX5543080.1 anaerobic ribonucleoside-triphosphate reductase activating protein [Paraburkholderia sp. CNPSo 3076]
MKSCGPDFGPQAPRTLRVGGVVPFTATDYPGQIAAVVFVQGCPWRCAYCHNPHLQPRTRNGALEWQAVLNLLMRRVGLLDAVVFSGGEPTGDPALGQAIRDVRTLGFKVGLHTAGTHPRRLGEVLPLVDWVGLDVKAAFGDYASVTRVPSSGKHARASLEVVLASGVQYECRTTLHPGLLPEGEVLKLAQTLAAMNITNYALQVFRTQGCHDDGLNAVSMAGYPDHELVGRIAALFPAFTLRRG